MPAKTITRYGDAVISTAAYVFGNASGYFDGAGDYLECADSDDFWFDTGNFTIDVWIRFVSFSSSSGYAICGQIDPNNGNNYWTFEVINSRLSFSYGYNGSNLVGMSTAALVWNNNQWYHVAVVKNGSSIKLYKDGTGQSIDTSYWYTAYSGAALSNISSTLKIGSLSGSNRYFSGYMDEFRLSKGIARWTANFTPPTSKYLLDSHTKLLLHFEGSNGSTAFKDSVYKTSGSAVFGPYQLPSTTSFRSSCISWAASTPTNTSLAISCAVVDIGTGPVLADYQTCTNGGAIPGIASGKDLYIKADLSTTDSSFSPTLSALQISYEGADDRSIVRLTLAESGRLKYPQGNVSIAYTASSGNLKNEAGTLALPSFSAAVNPDESKLALMINPNDPENIQIGNIDLTVDVNKIAYVSGKNGDEQIQVGNIDLAVTVYDTNNNQV